VDFEKGNKFFLPKYFPTALGLPSFLLSFLSFLVIFEIHIDFDFLIFFDLIPVLFFLFFFPQLDLIFFVL